MAAGIFESNAGGRKRVRTDDPHNAIVVLYQLSYTPTLFVSRHYCH